MARSWPNVRIGIRSLLRTPGSTAVAVTTLALGIGANTAIFSLVNALLLRPLPLPHPEQLVALSTTIADNINGDEPFTLQMFEELSRRQQIFSELFAWNGGSIKTFEANGNRFAAALAEVSGNYYRAIGVAPLLGRFIESSDVALENGTSNAVAVISYRAWRSWYHGDANVIGAKIRMGNQPFTIIGVEPEGYSGLIIDGATDVTVPIFAPGQLASRDAKILWLRLYGRLKQDWTYRERVRVLPRFGLAFSRPPYLLVTKASGTRGSLPAGLRLNLLRPVSRFFASASLIPCRCCWH